MKKFLPYILILLILGGLSGLETKRVSANDLGICKYTEEGYSDDKSPEGTPGHGKPFTFEREIVVPNTDCPYLKTTYWGNTANANPPSGDWKRLSTSSSDLGTCTYNRISPLSGNASHKITSTTKEGDCPPTYTFFDSLIWIRNTGGGGTTGVCTPSQGDANQTGTCNYYKVPPTTIPYVTPYNHSDTTRAECNAACDPKEPVFTAFSPHVVPGETPKCESGKVWNGKACVVLDLNYYFLAPLPCTGTPETGCKDGKLVTFDPTGNNKIGAYLNIMIGIFIGICAVLAVIMIVMGGIQYMTSEFISSKEAGKERIRNAIFGLLLALGAYTLLFTINPNLLNTDLSSLTQQTVTVEQQRVIDVRSGKGKCEPITSGICSPASLKAAGFLPEPSTATQASSICNGESTGVASLASGVDVCSNGTDSFSFGLFQINILAHANEIPGGMCRNIFTVDPNPPGKVGNSSNDNTLGGCLQRNSGGICLKYACKVTNTANYQSCKNYITNTTNNIAYAVGLQASRGWSQWGANASCHF